MLTERVQELVDGVIRADELYTISRFRRCLQLTVSAMRSLRLAGLPVIAFGKRRYVSGRQAIEFMERLNDGRKITSQGASAR